MKQIILKIDKKVNKQEFLNILEKWLKGFPPKKVKKKKIYKHKLTKEEMKIRRQKFYQRHKEYIKEKSKEYYQKNKEEINERNKIRKNKLL